jgi:peptidoglycan biosynthesis protein MviN/MurJ (putative lipid II flippase)
MAWVFLFLVLGRLAGAAREIAIAARYGTGPVVDAYLFVFNLVTWPVAVWLSILTVVLVPAVARLNREGVSALPLQGGLLSATLALGGALTVVVGLALWIVLGTSGRLLPEPGSSLARDMTVYLAPLVLVGSLSSLYSAWLMAIGRHANTLIEAIPPVAILVAVLAVAQPGAELLLWGTVIGFVLQLAVLCGYLGHLKSLAWPRFSGPSPDWRALWWSIGVVAIGQVLSTSSGTIDQIMAAPLGTGAIATLGYANRILAVITGLVAMVVSRATLPVFSATHAESSPSFYRLGRWWTGVLFAGGFTGAVVAYLLTPWGVAALFERGAFTANDTLAVAHVFAYGLPQLPFYCAGLVLVSLLAAAGNYWVIAGIGALNLVVKVAANWLLIQVLGIAGITLATGIMYAVSMAVMMVILVRPMWRETPRRPATSGV